MNNARKLNFIDIERLVRSCQHGSRGAFDELVKISQQRAMQVATGILANADEAAEAVQAGFVKAYLNIKKLKEPKRFEAWLLRIVANTAITQRKTAKRRKELINTVSQEKSSLPFETEDATELSQAIQQAISKLSKKQAQAISLFGLKDLSHREVAEIMNCSIEAARWHVFQARRKLKVLLKDYLK